MKQERENVVKGEQGIHPAELHFRRELSLLTDNATRIQNILDRIYLYTHDIKDLHPEVTDDTLLWLVSMLKEQIKAGIPDLRVYGCDRDLVKRFMHVYNVLPIQNNNRWAFPKTKEEILCTILCRWEVGKFDDFGREIIKFVWGIYKNDRPLDERKAIDKVMREHLVGADPLDVEKWIKWIKEATQISVFREEYGEMNVHLARHFVMARARGSNLEEVWWNIRFREIVDGLGIWNVQDKLLPALRAVCQAKLEQMRED